MKRGSKVALAYAALALVTFGYSADEYQRAAWARYSVCRTVVLNTEEGADDCRQPWPIDAPLVGLFSGAAWPLYWSWTVAAKARARAGEMEVGK